MKPSDLIFTLLPDKADNSFRGKKLALIVFTWIAVLSTLRSLIHMFAPDGGAGSIAGLDLAVEGASGVIFAFALWGSSQLVYAGIQLIVAFHYRSLIPLMYVLLIIETILRMLVGGIKPVDFAHTPPGAFGNYVVLPVALVMLILCFLKPTKE
jgi:hypothetical protein